MTTLTELLTNKAKIQYKPEIVLVRNPKLQEFINDLNSMFLKNWTPLFKEEEYYENWSEETKPIHIYLGNDSSGVISLKIKNISLNKIVISSGQSFTSKFSITLEDAYKTILICLIKEKFRTYFQEKFKDSYLGKSFEPQTDFISIFKTIKYVFGEDSLIEKENSVKFKDKIISIPNLEMMKLYYGENKYFDIKEFIEKNIKDYSIEIFKLLKVHFKIKLQLVTTINDLSDAYFKEINNYYKKYHIEKIKKVYLETCNKYFINPNEYILMPGLTNDNNLYWDFIPKKTTLATDDTYYFLNNYMFHRLFKKVSKENFYKSFEEMKEDMFRHFLFYKQENITKQIIQESSKSLNKIKNYSRFFEEKIDFNGKELKVKRSGNVFTLTHNLYRLYYDYSVHNIDVKNVKFEKMEEPEKIENEWEIFCKEIENERDLFIDFLNS